MIRRLQSRGAFAAKGLPVGLLQIWAFGARTENSVLSFLTVATLTLVSVPMLLTGWQAWGCENCSGEPADKVGK